jgi:hypothetical protein
MHRFIRGALCGVIVAAALLVVGGRGRDVHVVGASGDDPQILLSSITVDITVDAPAYEHPELPTYVHLGYGVTQPKAFDPESGDVVFYDLSIFPSSESRTYDANIADNSKAAALANDLTASPLPDSRTLLFAFQVTPGTIEGVGRPDLVMHIAPGARINDFKMTVAPFTIEKRIVDPFHSGAPTRGQPTIKPRVTIGGPYSVYRMITTAPVAVIQAYGPPPPGDATCDAVANSIDALFVEQHAAGLLDSLPCAKAADANGDGAIDSVDASLILQFAAGLIGQP